MAVSSMVPNPSENCNIETTSFATPSTSSIKPPGSDTSVNNKQNIKTSGLDGFRPKLLATGISERASQLISSTKRHGSLSNYNLSWSKSAGWCGERKIDPFRCAISKVLDYLSYLFDLGYKYRTVGCHRSVISTYHGYVDNKPMGQHPHVCALLKGVFNERPPQPIYVFIWDIKTVLDFVKCQWSGCDLSDKVLSYKLVVLMALSPASGASAIHHLDVRYMLKTEVKFVFTLHKLRKGWKYGKAPQSLEFCEYTEDRDYCVVTALNEYIEHTYQRHAEKRCSQLLFSFIQPYVELSSSTVSIKGHSTRAASSSKASKAGLFLADILAIVSWSSSSTWQRFYNKLWMRMIYFRKLFLVL